MPASPRLISLVLSLVMGAALGCGATAAPGRAVRAGAHAADGSEAGLVETQTKVDGVLVRLAPERKREGLDARIAELTRAAEQTGYTDLTVLTELSGRQIDRGSLGADDVHRDLASAESNLSRVLAIDEHSATAMNELARLHLARARQRGRAELELAMAVCLRATREHPLYAPLRNTEGLVALELRDALGAVKHFEAAVKLDAWFSEAQKSLAASLLVARQFEAAERAYDRAIDVGGDDYEAHLGRALARRGQINSKNFQAQVASVESDLERCKQLDPERYAKEVRLAKLGVRDLGSKGF